MRGTLESLPGVASVDINPKDLTATIAVDPAKFSVEDAMSALMQCGFPADTADDVSPEPAATESTSAIEPDAVPEPTSAIEPDDGPISPEPLDAPVSPPGEPTSEETTDGPTEAAVDSPGDAPAETPADAPADE